jgi:hypothetical protein
MPGPIYEAVFKNFPGDFRLINQQFLLELVAQKRPLIMETPLLEIQLKYPESSAYWEIQTLTSKPIGYIPEIGVGPNGYDILTPPTK